MQKSQKNLQKNTKKVFSFALFESALESKGLSAYDFAQEAGLHPGTISNLQKTKRIYKKEIKNSIERILGVKYEDLCVPAEADIPEGLTNVEPLEPTLDNGIHDHRLEWPVVGTSAAGPQLSAVEVSEYPGVADRWEALPAGVKCPDPNGFALVITGDSMAPRLPDGCIVFVAPGIQPQSGEVALVLIEGRAGGRESCVKVIYDEGDSIRLHSYNETAYPDKSIPKKYIINTYKVIAYKYLVSGEL